MNKEAKTLIGLGILTIVLVGLGVWFFSGQKPAEKSLIDASLLEGSTNRKISSDSATITVVEFGDFQCPACAVAQPITKQVLKDYEGKVNFIFRHFPLPGHKNAMHASIAAEAAGEQGKFWEMYDKLFENQKDWEALDSPNVYFTKLATDMGLNIEQFTKDLESQVLKDRIKADQDDGFRIGVRSTPTFYVNGVEYAGALRLSDFRAIIDQLLSK